MKRKLPKSPADNPQRLKQLLAVLVARSGGAVAIPASEIDALSGCSFELWLEPTGAKMKLTMPGEAAMQAKIQIVAPGSRILH